MVTAGLDIGAKTTKVVIIRDRQVLAKSMLSTGVVQEQAVNCALDAALSTAHLERQDVTRLVATGAGRAAIPHTKENVTEVSADARALAFLHPEVRTFVDIGAEEARAVKYTPQGKVVDFCINERCAAGAGTFVEAMAHALEVELGEMGPLSLQATKALSINAQCTVFAESEVISLIHAKHLKRDIVRAVHEAIAGRTLAMLRRVQVEKEIAVVGGLARNVGFVDALQYELGTLVVIPADPEFVGALGAALAAQDMGD